MKAPNSSRIRLRQRLRYRFDNMLARGTWASLVWLGIVTVLVVGVSALLLNLFRVTLSGSEDSSYFEDFWQSLLRVIDPGTMAGDVGWGRRVLALAITVFGLLVAGTLIGVIAAGVENAIERMRRGGSAVFESGHVVVLGSSGRLPGLIRQLTIARVHRSDSVIVVMADRDSADMQDEVRSVVSDPLGSRLVFRSGDPTNRADLERVSLREAETVIVLGDEAAGDSPAVRGVIAVRAVLEDLDDIPVVVALDQPTSAEDLTRVYGDEVHPIVTRQAIARIAAFALREPGIGHVALALLDDRGSDIHISLQSDLEGLRFAEVVERLDGVRPIGRLTAGGVTDLNPAPDTQFDSGDRVVVISDGPGPFRASGALSEHRLMRENDRFAEPTHPDRHVVALGWSALGAHVLSDWAGIAAPGSTVEVLVDPRFADIDEVALPSGGGPTVTITPWEGFPDIGSRLARPAQVDTIVMFGYPQLGPEAADTRTLLDLVAVRRIIRTLDARPPRLMVELHDVDSTALAETDHPDDFVISESIGSQLIAQLAEQPDRRAVFLALYAPVGPSIHLVPAGVLGLGGRRQARDLFRSSYTAGKLAIGWRLSPDRGGGLVLNPPASMEADLSDDDQVVVIA